MRQILGRADNTMNQPLGRSLTKDQVMQACRNKPASRYFDARKRMHDGASSAEEELDRQIERLKLKVQGTQSYPTIQQQLVDQETTVERVEIPISKPTPGPKTSRQERDAARVKRLLEFQRGL
jgi:hypothetical protein